MLQQTSSGWCLDSGLQETFAKCKTLAKNRKMHPLSSHKTLEVPGTKIRIFLSPSHYWDICSFIRWHKAFPINVLHDLKGIYKEELSPNWGLTSTFWYKWPIHIYISSLLDIKGLISIIYIIVAREEGCFCYFVVPICSIDAIYYPMMLTYSWYYSSF